MKKNLKPKIEKTIEALRSIRRRPPPEFRSDEVEAISFSLDYLEEDLLKIKKK